MGSQPVLFQICFHKGLREPPGEHTERTPNIPRINILWSPWSIYTAWKNNI